MSWQICFSFFLDHWHYAITVVVQSLSCVHLFAIPWTAAFQSSPAAAKSLQSCPTLCDTIDGSPPGSPIPGILQARTLEWVAISFSKAWKWKVKVKSLSPVRLFITPWTKAHQAPPSMGFSTPVFWPEEFHGQSLKSQRVGHNWATFTFTFHWCSIMGDFFMFFIFIFASVFSDCSAKKKKIKNSIVSVLQKIMHMHFTQFIYH